ncbi:L-rhamnose mutarotase [Opitutaceae bacterium]
MTRKAFVMHVNAGREQAYAVRHNLIFANLEAVLKSHGVHNASIFLAPPTWTLFAYVEVEDEARWAAIAQTEECKRWWAFMKDVMPTNPDNSPVSKELREVFHLA